MNKGVYGYKLGRNTLQRKALFKGLMNALILEEAIETTLAKARSIKGPFEKLVTKAKVDSVNSRRELFSKLGLENTAAKMVEMIGPKFRERPGGYLRTIRLGPRAGDKATMVRLEFVEEIKPEVKLAPKKVEVAKEAPKIKVRRVKKSPEVKNA